MTIVNLGTAVGDNIIDFEALSDNNTFIGLDARRVGTVASHTVLIGSDSTGVNATFQDSILNHTTTGNTININANQFHMINFTNVSQANGTGITTSFTTGKNATISVNWWVDTFANYTNGSVAPNANITARDRNDDFRFELLTDANGRITKTYLTEYIINGTAGVTGVTTVYSNYTFNGTRSGGGQTINQSWNLTIARNLDLLFQFTPPATNVAPTNPSPKILSLAVIFALGATLPFV